MALQGGMGLLCPPPGAANPWGVVLLRVLPAQGTVPPPLSAAPGGSDPHPGTNPAPPQKQSFIYCVLSQARFCEEIPPAQPCPSITSGDSPHRERNPLAAGSPVCPQAGGEQQVPSRCRRVQRVTNLPPGGQRSSRIRAGFASARAGLPPHPPSFPPSLWNSASLFPPCSGNSASLFPTLAGFPPPPTLHPGRSIPLLVLLFLPLPGQPPPSRGSSHPATRKAQSAGIAARARLLRLSFQRNARNVISRACQVMARELLQRWDTLGGFWGGSHGAH